LVFPQIALALLILLVCCFAPGFFLVRRLRWNPLEKLCGAIGLSLLLLWFALWILYVAVPGDWKVRSVTISLICIALAAITWRDARRLLDNTGVRQALAAFGLLLLCGFVILATIRNYSGGGWGGDWLEHFQRTLVYLYHMPTGTTIVGGYQIPSRPPLAQVITGFILAQVGDGFEIFQVVFLVLNMLLFLPCCLILRLIARPRRGRIWLLACLFAMNPSLMVNGTYTGVKTAAAFFVILAVAFYLRGWKKNDRARMTLSFAFAAGGSLAHYSGMPYALFLGIHYLFAVFRHRKQRWKELYAIAAGAGVLLLAWFGWCVSVFGAKQTTVDIGKASVVYGHIYEGGFFLKFVLNLFDSLVPHFLRDQELVQVWAQPNILGYIRDNAFMFYQTSLIFTMGLVGGPLVYWLLGRTLHGRRGAERNFWLVFVPFSVAANFALCSERDFFGVAHITLTAMVAIGLTLLAANFGWRRWASMLLIAGCAIDFTLGIFLQTRIEHLENTPDHTVFSALQFSGNQIGVATPTADSLFSRAWDNWFAKHQYAYSKKWLREIDAFRPGDPALEDTKKALLPSLERTILDDGEIWHGWFSRHGGEIVFVGDHFGAADSTSVLLVLVAIGVLWTMARQIPRRQPVKVIVPKERPARNKK
jgi:hypothetical protein